MELNQNEQNQQNSSSQESVQPVVPKKASREKVLLGLVLGLAAIVLLLVGVLTGLFLKTGGAAESSSNTAATETREAIVETEPTATPLSALVIESTPEPSPTPKTNRFAEYAGKVACGSYFTLVVQSDGTVVRLGDSSIDTSDWCNITQVAASGDFAIGLCEDGTLVAAGDLSHGEGDVYSWTDV